MALHVWTWTERFKMGEEVLCPKVVKSSLFCKATKLLCLPVLLCSSPLTHVYMYGGGLVTCIPTESGMGFSSCHNVCVSASAFNCCTTTALI